MARPSDQQVFLRRPLSRAPEKLSAREQEAKSETLRKEFLMGFKARQQCYNPCNLYAVLPIMQGPMAGMQHNPERSPGRKRSPSCSRPGVKGRTPPWTR